jgi:hypothetical protein
MAIGNFDTGRAVALGNSVAYAYHVYDVEAGNRDQFPLAALPDGYAQVGEVFVNELLLSNAVPPSRLAAVKIGMDELINLNKPIGIIAASDSDVVLAFRGTQTGFEWIHNGEFLKTPFTFKDAEGADYTAGQAEAGFTSLYQGFTTGTQAGAPRLMLTLREAVLGKHLTITGHSLGAALATLAAMEAAVSLQGTMTGLSVLTFASPLVGDKTFAGLFDTLIPDSWRIANRPDIVTYLPPPFVGYSHVATEYPINSDHLTKHSEACWHALETYLFLLAPAQQPLQSACRA